MLSSKVNNWFSEPLTHTQLAIVTLFNCDMLPRYTTCPPSVRPRRSFVQSWLYQNGSTHHHQTDQRIYTIVYGLFKSTSAVANAWVWWPLASVTLSVCVSVRAVIEKRLELSTPNYRVSKKSNPPKAINNILACSAKPFWAKFCPIIGNLYPHMCTKFSVSLVIWRRLFAGRRDC